MCMFTQLIIRQFAYHSGDFSYRSRSVFFLRPYYYVYRLNSNISEFGKIYIYNLYGAHKTNWTNEVYIYIISCQKPSTTTSETFDLFIYGFRLINWLTYLSAYSLEAIYKCGCKILIEYWRYKCHNVR